MINEPVGWHRGTIRGMVMLWVSFTFCLLTIIGRIPVELAIPIFTMIIGSYFGYRKR